MTTLPIELFQEIFFYLHSRDKVQCMLVCRRWKDIIERYALFHTLIINSNDVLELIVEKIKKKPSIANKVERLIIGFIDKNTDVTTLLLLLTNIKILYCLTSENVTSLLESGEEYLWKESIKKIIDHSSKGPSCNLLLSSQCSNLTILTMDFQEKSPELFKNTPFLKTLVLTSFNTNFNGIEKLHENLPRLGSLKINKGTLDDSGWNIDSIEPAVLVTECAFAFSSVEKDGVEMNINLLKYVDKKYPNLSVLTSRCNRIMKTDEGITRLYNIGYMPLFHNLGTKLTKLTIDTFELSGDFFKILDQSKCQISYLRVSIDSLTSLLTITDMHQAHHIHTLKLKITKEVHFAGFFWLKKFEKLRKFKLISFARKSLYFKVEQILNNLPSLLRSLSFHNFHLNFDPKSTNIYPVEKLSLKWARLPVKIDTFIAQYCPKLSTLKLKHCIMDSNIFDLGSLDLVKFTLTVYFAKEEQALLTVCNNRKRWYTYKKWEYIYGQYASDRQCIFPVSFKLSTENKTNDPPFFILKCNSVIIC